MINSVVLVGRLTKDPELKYTQGGVAVTRFTLAVNRPFTNQQGQREADFVNCVTWRKQAENTANFLRKGSLTGIEGRIQTSNFEGKDGNRVFMTEVVADSVQFLEPRSANAGGRSEEGSNAPYQGAPFQGGAQQQQPSYQQSNYQPNQQNYTRTNDDPFSTGGGPIEVSDDDLPF
ncbi:single-stranded DNA-binding protein [Sporosarcina jiandibaonis]|uniref:single-stranded DNA-binding protein n=1 Tax=Sporosarcina jiandibaonis TaxID=2715535 RepID=UPI0015533D9B|nr:single-stranded DNA-binding protein [Sporosarcina jiandibaonis]